MALKIPAQFNIASHFVDGPADAHPDRMAICGEPAQVTYGELRAMVNRAGNALVASDVRRGERVLIALADSAEFMAAFFGAAKIGAIAVPVNPLSRPADFSYFVEDCLPSIAIVDAAIANDFLIAGAAQSIPLVVAGAPNDARGKIQGESWQQWTVDAATELVATSTAASEPAFFLYTSGSTGGPKAAVHQHKDMLATTEAFAKGVLQLTDRDRTFSVSKLFFAYGLGNGMYFPLAVGASTLLNPERPKPGHVLSLVAKHRPTVFFSVPTFYAALLREAEQGTAVDFSSVRTCVSAGEALPVEILEQFKRRFGLEILDAIGSTEMLHMFISSLPGKIRAGSCGFPLPGYEATIVDESGRVVPHGEIGNLWVKGPSAFAEYWNTPEKTCAARAGDWVITGDKFFCDADGYYHYCGRADDMLKVSGMWVAPGEVENALLAHPAVAEAAVVGAISSAGLTRVLACVVVREGHLPGPELAQAIQGFARARLAAYKCPQEVAFVAELPKTATGKIQRFRLRPAGGAAIPDQANPAIPPHPTA